MSNTIGVLAVHQITTALVANGEVVRTLQSHPGVLVDVLSEMPGSEIVARIAQQVHEAAGAETIDAVGLAIPGIVRHGWVEESPNLPQLKGTHLSSQLAGALRSLGRLAPVFIFNDADAIAAGIAVQVEELNHLIRVWMLGSGVGFGRYPSSEGIWEGGHMVVTLDPKENHCACGGVGHLEGIMGNRAIRLRFMDREPNEVFSSASKGDTPCHDFVLLWHRALAAACASCIHLDGPGEFFITGPNSRFVDLRLLTVYTDSMVGMSPLQGSSFKIVETGEEVGVLGAAVNANLALGTQTQEISNVQ